MTKSYFKNILFYGSLCIIVVAGLILRLIAIQEKPFWIDEAWTLYFAHTYSYQKLLFEAPVFNDIHPGLYYTIVKTLLASSPSIEILRIITSLLPQAVALLVFLSWCLRRKILTLTILISAGAVSFSPFLIHYSWQLRMYSLMFLWTSIITTIIADFLFYSPRWSLLYILLPFIVLANATDISGYFLTVSVWSVIFIIKIVLQKTTRRDARQFVLWTGCLVVATIITLLPYYPFQTAQAFHRASWLSPPSLLYAFRSFPLTALGLDTAIFPTNDLALTWPFVTTIGIALMVIILQPWFLCCIPKRIQRIYSVFIILVLLVPVGGYIFSHVSSLARYIPLLHRYIPAISIFLPRFFAPQALMLHVLLAVTVSVCLQKGGILIRSIAIIVVISTLAVWVSTNQAINTTTDTDKLASYFANETIKTINPANSIFYPGYYSLFLLRPDLRVPPQSVALAFTNSNIFEETIKTTVGNTYCALTKQSESFTLLTSTTIPSFFSPFTDNLNRFTHEFCLPITKDNNDSIVYTCRCLAQTKLDNDK